MAHVPQARLFSWEDVESGSDLDRLSLALDSLPDDALMQALEARRAKGRDDYPVQAMWNAVIARSRSRYAEVPLPGGLRGECVPRRRDLPRRRRRQSRRLRADRSHQDHRAGSPHLRADAPWQPKLASGPQPAQRTGTNQQPYRQQLRLRAPLHPRHAQDEAAGRAGLCGHARDGARAHQAGACSPNALTGPDSTTGQRLAPPGDSPASPTPDRESPAGTAGAQGSLKPEKPGADDKEPAPPRLLRLPVRRQRR